MAMYNADLAGVDVEELKAEILASINDMGEWKLQGSVTGTSTISLPSEFKELLIEVLYYDNANDMGASSIVIPQNSLKSTSKSYYLATYDKPNSQSHCVISINTSTINLATFYQGSTNLAQYCTTKVYYR